MYGLELNGSIVMSGHLGIEESVPCPIVVVGHSSLVQSMSGTIFFSIIGQIIPHQFPSHSQVPRIGRPARLGTMPSTVPQPSKEGSLNKLFYFPGQRLEPKFFINNNVIHPVIYHQSHT